MNAIAHRTADIGGQKILVDAAGSQLILSAFPEQAEPLAVPADDCLGLDDEKGILPAWPQARKEDPEHAVERTKPRPWSFPFQDRHLLAESDVFQL